MIQRILSYFFLSLLLYVGLDVNVVGANKLCGSFFDGDFWLNKFAAVCGEIVVRTGAWFCINEGIL